MTVDPTSETLGCRPEHHPTNLPQTSLEYDGSVVVNGQICIRPSDAAPDGASHSERRRNTRLFAAAPKLYIAAKLAQLRHRWYPGTPGSFEAEKQLRDFAAACGWKPDESLLAWIDSYTAVAVSLAEDGGGI